MMDLDSECEPLTREELSRFCEKAVAKAAQDEARKIGDLDKEIAAREEELNRAFRLHARASYDRLTAMLKKLP